MPPRRSPVALSQAVTRDLRFRIRLAGLLGAGALLATWLLNGFLLFNGPVDPLDGAMGGAAWFGVAIGAMAVPLLWTRERRALEAVYWAGAESARRWKQTFGDPRVPATPKAGLSWLARHPEDTDETRAARVFVKLVIGDLHDAALLASRLPAGTALQRFQREASSAMVRMVEGSDPGIAGLRRLAAGFEGDERLRAEIDVDMVTGLLAAGDGGDWRAPMQVLRDRVGGRASGALRVLLLWIVISFAVGAIILALAGVVLRSLAP